MHIQTVSSFDMNNHGTVRGTIKLKTAVGIWNRQGGYSVHHITLKEVTNFHIQVGGYGIILTNQIGHIMQFWSYHVYLRN